MIRTNSYFLPIQFSHLIYRFHTITHTFPPLLSCIESISEALRQWSTCSSTIIIASSHYHGITDTLGSFVLQPSISVSIGHIASLMVGHIYTNQIMLLNTHYRTEFVWSGPDFMKTDQIYKTFLIQQSIKSSLSFFYLFLLLEHIEINFIWAIHQAHHSGEDFTMTSALRQAVLQPFTAWVGY